MASSTVYCVHVPTCTDEVQLLIQSVHLYTYPVLVYTGFAYSFLAMHCALPNDKRLLPCGAVKS